MCHSRDHLLFFYEDVLNIEHTVEQHATTNEILVDGIVIIITVVAAEPVTLQD